MTEKMSIRLGDVHKRVAGEVACNLAADRLHLWLIDLLFRLCRIFYA